jgi:xylose isomerase
MPKVSADLVKRKYPGYQLDVVTEITDGEKVFYLVKVISDESVKTLSVSDGKIEVLEDLVNGGLTKR